jgi:hypothetical protein
LKAFSAGAGLTALVLAVGACSSRGAHATASVSVPNVVARTPARATQELTAQHLVAKVLGDFGIGKVGTIIRQSPAAGDRAPSGSTVRIIVLLPDPGGGTGPLNVAANLGPCGVTPPNTTLTQLNAGVGGLDTKLVPVAARKVRICEYGHIPSRLERSGLVGAAAAVHRFDNETDRLASKAGQAQCRQPAGASFYVVTVADAARQVTILLDGCGFVSNGLRYAPTNASWMRNLVQHTSAYATPR